MGLFGKKKTTEELIEKAMGLYATGEYLKAALALLKIPSAERCRNNAELEFMLAQCYFMDAQKTGSNFSRKTADSRFKSAAKAGSQKAQMKLQEMSSIAAQPKTVQKTHDEIDKLDSEFAELFNEADVSPIQTPTKPSTEYTPSKPKVVEIKPAQESAKPVTPSHRYLKKRKKIKRLLVLFTYRHQAEASKEANNFVSNYLQKELKSNNLNIKIETSCVGKLISTFPFEFEDPKFDKDDFVIYFSITDNAQTQKLRDMEIPYYETGISLEKGALLEEFYRNSAKAAVEAILAYMEK